MASVDPNSRPSYASSSQGGAPFFKTDEEPSVLNTLILGRNVVVRHLQGDSGCSEKLNEWLKDNFFGPSPYTTLQNVDHPKAIYPSEKALKALAEHYRTKYDIKILVLTFSQFLNFLNDTDADFSEARNKILENTQHIGVIVRPDRENDDTVDTDHITAVLLQLNGDRKEAVVIDSLGYNSEYLENQITTQPMHDLASNIHYNLERAGVKSCFSIAPGQADSHSCRIGGIVLLRNALLDLKHEKPLHLTDRVTPVDKPEGGVLIPSEWDYTNQISNKSGSEGRLVKKDFFSNVDRVQRTVSEFRKLHAKKQTLKFKMDFPKHRFSVFPPAGFPDHCTHEVTASGTFAVVTGVIERVINVYLQCKGEKLAEKVDKLPIPEDYSSAFNNKPLPVIEHVPEPEIKPTTLNPIYNQYDFDDIEDENINFK